MGLGKPLMSDAILRSWDVSGEMGVRALLVDLAAPSRDGEEMTSREAMGQVCARALLPVRLLR